MGQAWMLVKVDKTPASDHLHLSSTVHFVKRNKTIRSSFFISFISIFFFITIKSSFLSLRKPWLIQASLPSSVRSMNQTSKQNKINHNVTKSNNKKNCLTAELNGSLRPHCATFLLSLNRQSPSNQGRIHAAPLTYHTPLI